MPFLMDSNTFIQAKNQFYRFSFCPGFWNWIAAQHAAGSLSSVSSVEIELKEGNDELTDWVKNGAPKGFFIAPVPAVVTTQAVVARWVSAQAAYSPAEKARFLAKADPWLIAEAIDSGREVITFEEFVPANSSKVKIPNVATNFGVKCASLFDVLEASGVRLRI
jgi:hypothetical protein